jgi:hypothetical protein
MFLAGTQLSDEYLFVIGLSAENRRRMENGRPIFMTRASHGMAVPAGVKVVIFAGETEDSMREQMSSLIGPSTVIDQKSSH